MLNERRLAVEQALHNISISSQNVVVYPDRSLFQVANGLALHAENLLTAQVGTLQPLDVENVGGVGFAFPTPGQNVIIRVDQHTEVILEGRLHGTLRYSVFVDGQPRESEALHQPVAIGSNPEFQVRGFMRRTAERIDIPEANEQMALLLVPARDQQGRMGYLVANTTNQTLMPTRTAFVDIITAPRQAVGIHTNTLPPLNTVETEQAMQPIQVFAEGLVRPNSKGEPCEDIVAISRDRKTVLAFDGMHGMGDGYEAANEALEAISAMIDLIPNDASAELVARRLEQALRFAHTQVNKLPLSDKGYKPGTTAVVGRVVYGQDGAQLVLAWAGDSRAYMQYAPSAAYPQGRIEQLTTDDSLQHSYAVSGKEFVILNQNGNVAIKDYNPKIHRGLKRYKVTAEEAEQIDTILDIIQDPRELTTWTTDTTFLEKLYAFFRVRNVIDNNLGAGIPEAEFVPNIKIVPIPHGAKIWYMTDGVTDPLPRGKLYTELLSALIGISYPPPTTPMDVPVIPPTPENLQERLRWLLQILNHWNQDHPGGKHKDDDQEIATQLVFLAA